MIRYVLSAEARQDIEEIRAYYVKEANARVARYVLGEVTHAFQFLAAHPGIGHLRTDLTREPLKFWQVFAYLIAYDPVARPIGIARVLHASRNVAAVLACRP